MTPALNALTRINLDDLVNAFGWQDRPLASRLVRTLFFKTAQDFARQMLSFDEWIGSRGLEEAACLAEKFYVQDVRLYGGENLPDGPCIFLANHPGMTDTLALLAALPHPDLRIIALDRPFLLSLPNLTSHLLFVRDGPQERIALVRSVHRHLRAGGSVLTFPAGQTEPDPDTQTGAAESLASWTESVGVFVRTAPETPIVPVCVRGVNWGWAVNHPLVRLRRSELDRHLLGSAMQLIANVSFHVRPVIARVQVGAPLRLSDIGSNDVHAIHRAVLSSMKCLVENAPAGPGVGLL